VSHLQNKVPRTAPGPEAWTGDESGHGDESEHAGIASLPSGDDQEGGGRFPRAAPSARAARGRVNDGAVYLGQLHVTDRNVTIHTGYRGRPPALARADIAVITPAEQHPDVTTDTAPS